MAMRVASSCASARNGSGIRHSSRVRTRGGKRPASFTAPLANALDLLTLWTDKATVPTFGVMLVLGVLIGSYVSARLRREFKLEAFESPRELVEHVLGAVMMGFGGVTALGC